MAEYADGTRDCPNCIHEGRTCNTWPRANRIRGDMLLCIPCDAKAHVEAVNGQPAVDRYARDHARFHDWLVEQGRIRWDEAA